MEYQEYFKFLNFELMNRKNAENLPENEKKFLILNILDKNNNPCKFVIFNKDLVSKVIALNPQGLQDILVTFKIEYSNNLWNVRPLDINC